MEGEKKTKEKTEVSPYVQPRRRITKFAETKDTKIDVEQLV